VGVVTCILLGEHAPFDGTGAVGISNAAKTMIRNMLQVDPETRYSVELALQCLWMIVDCGRKSR
jgi:hypothetical protein